jgi:hypothetical protein
VVSEGDGETLVVNTGPATVFFGDDNGIRANDASSVVPITPNSYFAVTGEKNLFACVLPGQSASLSLISGGLNFFLPVTSLTIPYGSTGQRIVINPPSNPGSIVGYDASGNVTFVISSAGFTIGPTGQPQIFLSGGVPAEIIFPLNDAGFTTNRPAIYAETSGPGVARFATLVLDSPTTILAAHDDYVELELNSPNADGSSSANLQGVYFTPTGSYINPLIVDYKGLTINACNGISAIVPGTGTTPANPAQSEVWHIIPMDAGWTVQPNYPTPMYRKLADGNLQLTGVAFASYATSAGKNLNGLNPLPPGYRPAAVHDWRSGDLIGNRCHMSLGTTGIITGYPPNGATFTGNYYCDCEGVIAL